jgi:hypothetical protein
LELIVYTAVMGKTDPLHDPEVDGARFVCFTDQKLKSKRWEIVQMDKQEAPTRAARVLKLNPHHLFPEADASLWIDACFTLRTPLEKLLELHPEDIVNFRHRDRTRIVDEAHQIAKLGKARKVATFSQLSQYQSEGFDTAQHPMRELSCNGVVMRRHTARAAEFNELWTRQIEQHTLRDQLSADYVAWRLGITLGRWNETFDKSPHFSHAYFQRPVNDY